jgi:hypothetical protein
MAARREILAESREVGFGATQGGRITLNEVCDSHGDPCPAPVPVPLPFALCLDSIDEQAEA